jgi:aromatic ring-opening dioxygenase catalytic subunit (LigB family)
MGSLVFAGAISHAPGIAAFRNAAGETQRGNFFKAADVLRERIEQAQPDALLVIAPDHFSNFFVDNMPAACITMNEKYEGPVEDWLNIPKLTIPGNQDLARALLQYSFKNGIEPAFSHQVKLEHGVLVALQMVTPRFDIPIVWVMQNCQVPPMLSLRRCYAFGRAMREAIDGSDLRVGVLGTGGLSHAPGAPEADELDPEFDKHFLSLLDRNAVEELLDMPSERIDEAGFGTWEIRQWITALGVANDRHPRTLAYEAVVGWDTGCGAAIYE